MPLCQPQNPVTQDLPVGAQRRWRICIVDRQKAGRPAHLWLTIFGKCNGFVLMHRDVSVTDRPAIRHSLSGQATRAGSGTEFVQMPRPAPRQKIVFLVFPRFQLLPQVV